MIYVELVVIDTVFALRPSGWALWANKLLKTGNKNRDYCMVVWQTVKQEEEEEKLEDWFSLLR